MQPIIEEFSITLKYQVSVDTETGEMTTKCISRKIDKIVGMSDDKPSKKANKIKKEESSEPTLILEDNKYTLNQAAINLMQIDSDCKLDIKYEKRGKNTVPVIGSDDAFKTKGGNKLTKSNTVACRGSKREELAKYGSEFILIPHDTKEGIFILQNKDEKLEQILEDPSSDLPMDIDLQDLIDTADATITEIDSSMFKL